MFNFATLFQFFLIFGWGLLFPVELTASAAPKPVDKAIIASVQYPIEGNRTLAQILSKADSFVQTALKKRATLVVFPELTVFDAWPLGDKRSEKEVSLSIAKTITGAYFDGLAALAIKHRVSILAGSAPALLAGKVFNRSTLILPDGKQLVQEKLFLTPWEKAMGWTASDRLHVFSTPWGKTAILVCYDVEHPVVTEMLAKVQPDLILVPSMTDSEQGLRRVRWSAQTRSIEHHAFVVIASTVHKTTKAWDNVGQSALLAPSDGPFEGLLAEGNKNKSEVVSAELDFGLLRARRAKSGFVPSRSQKGRLLELSD